jgi:para-aminobenzoate synthetase / 4-amino-4-deoxychorismate lyase
MSKPFYLALKSQTGIRVFENPEKVYKIDTAGQVIPTLQALDTHLNHGKYIAGFLSYEAAAGIDAANECHKSSSFPKLLFGVFNGYTEHKKFNFQHADYKIGAWVPSQKRGYYNKNIDKIKTYIAAGETYQVNYTMRLSASFHGDTRTFFSDLSRCQYADYAAYAEFDNYALCSVSPELFFKLDGDLLFCKPMKGTAARGLSYQDDLDQQKYLRQSPKEQAENLMIVDMIRNDMGRICKAGSVKVSSLFETGRYPTVWQMTSDVTGETSASFSEIIRALFPCASVTGAPKVSTMKIINQLEQTPRNIYTGAIGYFGPNREAQFNVAIRTALIDQKKGKAEYGVGGGIVWDSVDKNEYEECRVKARVLTEKHRDFKVLETVLWNKKDGFFLLDYHLKRLAQSAEYFLFTFKRESVLEKLQELDFNESENLKIRILTERNGKVHIESQVVQLNNQKKISVGVANHPIKKDDVFLYHKTTFREVYKQAVEQAGEKRLHDVLLWNEEGEMTESTIGNLVVKRGGKYYTPPLSCGLLNGTFRQYLIALGKLQEKIILKDELENYEEIYIINSVHKWQKAVLYK